MKILEIIIELGTYYNEGSNDSLWIQFIITLLGAFLAFIASYIIFYKQIQRERKNQIESLRSEHTNKLNYFVQLLESILKKFADQGIEVNRFIANQEQDLLEIVTPKKVAYNDFRRLNNIDSRGVFEAFGSIFSEDQDWIKRYSNIHSSLDFIDSHLNNLFTTYNLNYDYCIQELLKVKESLNAISYRLSQIAIGLHEELGDARFNNEIYQKIDYYIKRYMELVESRPNFEIINNDFLKPIMVTIINEIPALKSEPRFEEILLKCKDSRVRLSDIKNKSRQLIIEFQEFQEKNVAPLEYINNEMEKLKLKLSKL